MAKLVDKVAEAIILKSSNGNFFEIPLPIVSRKGKLRYRDTGLLKFQELFEVVSYIWELEDELEEITFTIPIGRLGGKTIKFTRTTSEEEVYSQLFNKSDYIWGSDDMPR